MAEKKALAKGFGLTFGQSEVLGLLNSGGPKTVPQMARRLNVSRQNVQVTANKLLARDLIISTANPDHQLSSLLRLSTGGENVSKAIADREEEIIARFFEGVDIGEKTLLQRTLQNLLKK
ncbi:MAG: MarR family winged helix-turn-helix transcriptional regulator [Alphaproteobacteria bacterium]